MPSSQYTSEQTVKYQFTAEAVAARPTTWFVSLHTSNPGATGANELTVGADSAYVRKAVTFVSSLNGTVTEAKNSGAVTFDPAGAGASYNITHIGIWSASTAGNFLQALPLPATLPIVAGTVTSFAINDIVIQGT